MFKNFFAKPKLKPLHLIQFELFFIRVISDPELFLHPDGADYVVKKGLEGAAVWQEKAADSMINLDRVKNKDGEYLLEKVPAKELLKNTP